jgi:hypothetical protein
VQWGEMSLSPEVWRAEFIFVVRQILSPGNAAGDEKVNAEGKEQRTGSSC